MLEVKLIGYVTLPTSRELERLIAVLRDTLPDNVTAMIYPLRFDYFVCQIDITIDPRDGVGIAQAVNITCNNSREIAN